jgi:nitrate reductase assembly molybdenum cofactor insertion protein NarJ
MVATEPQTSQSRVLELFAELLEYPRPRLADTARECRDAVASESSEAAALLEEFISFVERTPRSTLEEVFTATFDLNAGRHPYIGFHLFGEAYKRSVFMLELRDRYRKYRFDHGSELADHLSVMLRFMAICDDEEAKSELARDALIRSLEPMMVSADAEPVAEGEEGPVFFDVGDDYSRVLKALRLVLINRYGMPSELEIIPIPDQSRLVS